MKGWRLQPVKCWNCGKRCMWGLCPACRKLTAGELKRSHIRKTN